MEEQGKLDIQAEKKMDTVEGYQFEPIKGYPMLHWKGKRPFTSTQFYPAQLKESYGEPVNNWMNKIFWGDNLQVMSHLLKEYRGKIDLIYIDPPYDSKADYKLKISTKGKNIQNDINSFEEKQYTDIWSNDDYLQFMYERLLLMKELLSDNGAIYLHCDYRKVHQLKLIMDEIFGESNFLNHIIWEFSTRSSIKTTWKRSHNDILYYKKSYDPVFNWDDDMVLEPLSESTISKYKYEDENGRYRLNGRNLKGSPVKSAKDVDPKWEITNPEYVVRDYLREGKVPNDFFFIDIENQASKTRTNYPTQKPEQLLYKLISASTRPGDIVFDCFMGSGTTQAVAMKLGRRFIGADINLGAIETSVKRLIGLKNEIQSAPLEIEYKNDDNVTLNIKDFYLGFSIYNVNNYDVFRNPIEAKELLKQALEIQPLPNNSIYDGEKDGRMVKIMPVNRIATRADLNELISGFDNKSFEKKYENSPNKPVESLLLVCMGHEPDLAASLQKETHPYKLDVEVVDILRDKSNLEFKRDSEAEIVIEKHKLIIKQFYPMNLLQKLSIMKENVEDWKELTESIKVDFNYDGAVFEPKILDIPEKEALVQGIYNIPEDAGTIRIKITDLLSESLELTIENI
jgi:site-specific DNA-methyltransferase (adenine-specific)